MSDTQKGADGKFLFGFFIGGLIGALTIVFLGTKEGKKARKQLEARGQELTDDLMERIEALKEKGKQLAEETALVKEELAETIADTKEELTEEATIKIDSALSKIEEIQERGRDATAQLRKKFKNVPKKN